MGLRTELPGGNSDADVIDEQRTGALVVHASSLLHVARSPGSRPGDVVSSMRDSPAKTTAARLMRRREEQVILAQVSGRERAISG
ncbi:hypothetical protein WMF11_25890 [Sorangium sp. So ce295]|uniref:hypothetical protein n=1 Tax=Sorangium sp. So ce295 TaxID=3133295 RepID=UPI003F5EEB32